MGGPTCLISLSAPDITATATHMAAMAATMGGMAMDTHMHHRHTAVTTHTRAHTPGMAMATHTDRHTMVDTVDMVVDMAMASHTVAMVATAAMAMATLIRFPRQQPRTGQPIYRWGTIGDEPIYSHNYQHAK